ncbi:MAG: hypothetical protein D6695_04685 [Planctomycetota bacterium]|nr:MAG: hypothetical protein D6695_04685 [Planctomycetota bacterium]
MRLKGLDFTSRQAMEEQSRRTLSHGRRMLRENGRGFEWGLRPPVVPVFEDDDGRSWLLDGLRAIRYAPGSVFNGNSGLVFPENLGAGGVRTPSPGALNGSPLHLAAFRAAFDTGLLQTADSGTGDGATRFGQPVSLTNPPIDDPAADPVNHAAGAFARTPSHPGESFGESVGRNAMQQTGAQVLSQLLGKGGMEGALESALDVGNLINNGGSAALSRLVEQGLGALMGGVFGQVSDDDSLSKQLAARYGPQMLTRYGPAAVKSMASSGLPSVVAMLSPVPSKANIRLAKADPAGGAGGIVGVNGKAVLRLNDTLKMPELQDAGPMIEANTTVLINGMPAAGEIHKGVGLSKGAVGTPKDLSSNVFMGKGGGAAGGSTGSNGSDGGSGSEGSCIDGTGEDGGSCTRCERDRDPGAPNLDPPEWLKAVLGMERHTKLGEGELAPGNEYENWSILWGAIEIGSPQEPHAGIASPWAWWIPHRIFGFDMSDYYLKHDCVFDRNRRLSDAGAILYAEADAFVTGLSSSPVQNALQVVYSSATTIAGFTFAAANSLSDLFD